MHTGSLSCGRAHQKHSDAVPPTNRRQGVVCFSPSFCSPHVNDTWRHLHHSYPPHLTVSQVLSQVFPTRSFGRRVGRDVVDSYRRPVLPMVIVFFFSLASSHKCRQWPFPFLCSSAHILCYSMGCAFRHLRRVPCSVELC